MLTKDLQFTLYCSQRTAKWLYVGDAYFIDSCGKLRAMPSLADFHVVSSKIRKMKVLNARR